MKRLLWKELHEQIWLFLAALGAPEAILLCVRLFGNNSEQWPRNVYDLWLVYLVFAFWGATRMSHERESGRLTLSALPVPQWRVWLMKMTPGLLGAIAVSCFAHAAGRLGVYDIAPERHLSPFDGQSAVNIWIGAGEMATAYCTAFLASQFWSAGVSGVLGAAMSTFGWGWYWETVMRCTREAGPSWTFVGTLVVVSACAMIARGKGLPASRTGVAAAAVYFAIIGSMVAGFAVDRRLNSSHGTPIPHLGMSRPLVSMRLGLVAYASYPRQDPLGRSQRLSVFKLDGSKRRQVDKAPGILPLAWLSDGKLLFLRWAMDRRPIGAGAPIMQMMIWDSKSGRTRVLESLTYKDLERTYLWKAAGEPDGARIALARPAPPFIGDFPSTDLWLLDPRTGSKRLLWPNNATMDELIWHDGRIYWRCYNRLINSISPDGGRPRRENYLPPAEGGDSE